MMAVAHSRLLAHLVQLLHGFVGAFGWDKFGLPGWTQLCYVFLLLSIAVLEPICKAFTIPERLLLICVSLGALIGTYVVLFIVDGKYADGQYSFWSAGVQGRYLIPYALVGLLALKQDRMNVSSAVMAPVVLAGCTLYAVASIWCVAAYYG
jgi:uncharacterized membrane protein